MVTNFMWDESFSSLPFVSWKRFSSLRTTSKGMTNAVTKLIEAQPECVETGIWRLCSQPYWSRTWVAQEIILAKNLHVLTSTKEMGWGSLVQTIGEVIRTRSPLGSTALISHASHD